MNLELIVSGIEVVLSEVQYKAPEKVCDFHSAAKHLHKFAWPHLQTLICEVPKYSSAEQLVGVLSVQLSAKYHNRMETAPTARVF